MERGRKITPERERSCSRKRGGGKSGEGSLPTTSDPGEKEAPRESIRGKKKKKKGLQSAQSGKNCATVKRWGKKKSDSPRSEKWEIAVPEEKNERSVSSFGEKEKRAIHMSRPEKKKRAECGAEEEGTALRGWGGREIAKSGKRGT